MIWVVQEDPVILQKDECVPTAYMSLLHGKPLNTASIWYSY